ncbi:MAG TPA: hypothetical protein DIT13_03045 [Verrucomicrobiales bacterium]|nr:hypothetical protein [Verrucomicrobiales bacterium]HRJ10773.1 hypothetical protein [Prosthecobacter sp.]HRK16620.1 hypothetical protein [Prosthecobacter sp.]
MQKKNGNYEKVLLGVCALVAVGIAGFLVWQSQQFEERLTRLQASSKNDPGQPPTEIVKATIQRLVEKVSWVSPVIKGKPVPLNKSVRLVLKGDQLIDLMTEEVQLRPPMPNSFIVANDLPNYLFANFGDLDADEDGFSNLEEFNAKTNPKDSGSHPPVTDKLFLARRITHDYIIRLNSTSDPFQVQRILPAPDRPVSKFVSVGADFGFEKGSERFRTIKFEKKTIPDPSVGEKDVSELTVLDKATNKEFVVAKGTDTNLAEYEAEFEFLLGKRQTRVAKKGETFQIPGIGQTFRLLEVEEDHAVIQPVEEGSKPITIRKA